MKLAIEELRFQGTSIHFHHDARRLADGEDLNDALLDFFVRLGQALIPRSCSRAYGEGCAGSFEDQKPLPPVAFLGSLFFDMLRKGGAADGRLGHRNVAKWARRRLGAAGLFSPDVGALAVPVNEMMVGAHGKGRGKHWWLALVMNPKGCLRGGNGDAAFSARSSVLCLDSFVSAEHEFQPVLEASPADGSEGVLEVGRVIRSGLNATIMFRARGGAADSRAARSSLLVVGERHFEAPDLEVMVEQPRLLQGFLRFRLDFAARSEGEYFLQYGGLGVYRPAPRMELRRTMTRVQGEVARYLGGYLAKESESALAPPASRVPSRADSPEVELGKALCAPDVPQQENTNDCGFFILEQILRVLQLAPHSLTALAEASAEELTALPWPNQAEVAERKTLLSAALKKLWAAADEASCDDVELLLRRDEGLRAHVRLALCHGVAFAVAAEGLAAKYLPDVMLTASMLPQKAPPGGSSQEAPSRRAHNAFDPSSRPTPSKRRRSSRPSKG